MSQLPTSGAFLAAPAEHPRPATDLYTSHALAGHKCSEPPSPALVAPSDTQFLVFLDEEHQLDAAELGNRVTIVQTYDCLPVIEIAASDSAAARLTALPGVDQVIPSLGSGEQARGVAMGFNYFTRVARMLRTQSSPLPLGGIRPGSGSGYPVIVRKDPTTSSIELDMTIDWPAPCAILPSVNLSMGPTSSRFPFLKNDIVNMATYAAAREMLVTVSAGNCGDAGEDTMSAWARAPWVLAVGATADEQGQELASYSSRGRPADPTSGPDVVAWGTSAFSEKVIGTSFAAPRVAGLGRLIAAAMVQLGREVRLAEGDAPHGLPLLAHASIDDFGGEIWQDRQTLYTLEPALALPVAGVVPSEVIELVRAYRGRLKVEATPALLRELIISAARPVPGCRPHEVGAGFVDLDTVVARLIAVTGADLVKWFGDGTAPTGGLGNVRVFDANGLLDLCGVLGLLGPRLTYDYRRRRAGIYPLPDGAMRRLTLDQRIYGLDVT